MSKKLLNRIFIGVVVDNDDPKRLGRIKIVVSDVFESIATDDIPWASPWKDLNGNAFSIPDVGKIVNVLFNEGNINMPEYIYSQHYNINLINKLADLSDDEYISFKALFFDHNTQIYQSDDEGLKIDHHFTNINLTTDGSINLNLRDNNSKVNIGSDDAAQQAMLGNHWLEWFDTFVDQLLGNGGGPYLGNLGAPVICAPAMIDVLLQYQTDRETYVSKQVWVVDNDEVDTQTRPAIAQTGDAFGSTSNTIKPQAVIDNSGVYQPQALPNTGRAKIKDSSVQGNIQEATSQEKIPTLSKPQVNGDYKNGQIPLENMTKNNFLAANIATDNACYLLGEASAALDRMIAAFNSASFKGKQKLIFTDGYRTLERQQALYDKYGAGRAAKPGTSNHGWGVAIDMFWGIKTEMYKDFAARPIGFSHPNYVWFYNNGPQYGWFNPPRLRDDGGSDEWWHFEYHGIGGIVQGSPAQRYNRDFDFVNDVATIKRKGGTFV